MTACIIFRNTVPLHTLPYIFDVVVDVYREGANGPPHILLTTRAANGVNNIFRGTGNEGFDGVGSRSKGTNLYTLKFINLAN